LQWMQCFSCLDVHLHAAWQVRQHKHLTYAARCVGGVCTRYQGSVVSNTVAEDAQPWECVVVRWDKYEELMRVCPWELSDVQADAVGNKANKSRGSE
jgi:hypothetical protein